jgi:hypothetical protein
MDRHRTHALFQLGKVGIDVIRRDIRGSGRIALKQPTPIQNAKEIAVVPFMVFAGDWLEVAGGTSTLEPGGRLAGCDPSHPIGVRPLLQRQ